MSTTIPNTEPAAELADLHWLLTSPPLISCLTQAPNTAIIDGLLGLSNAQLPAKLYHKPHHELARRADFKRLGLYAEALYQYFCAHLSDATLVAHNLQIQHHNSGVTKGELDFLISHCDRLSHLEMAVKFYLFDSQQNKFIGPNAKDRLDKKLQRLTGHQLPLSHSPEGQQRLEEMGLPEPASSLLLKGVLFRHWQELKPTPNEYANPHFTINTDALWGVWLRQYEWPSFLAAHRHYTLKAIPKMAWMGLCENTPRLPATAEQLAPSMDEAVGMWLCSKPDGTHHGQRIMVVPDYWPQTAAKA